MTTLADLRARARAELGDESLTPLWPDERLNAWTREAVRGYGRALPRPVTLDLTSLAGQSGYTLPSEMVSVTSVEFPLGVSLPLARGAGPTDLGTFRLLGSELLLHPAPDRSGDLIRVRYAALYAEPGADADVLATPPEDDDLLVLTVAARALRWLWIAGAKSLRPAPADGASALDLSRRYERVVADELAARRRGVRTGQLSALGP